MTSVLSLAAAQRDFLSALLAPREAAEAAPPRICAAIDAAGVDAATRVEVYRNNVFSNYRSALQALYPVVERLVGEQFFRHACDRYIVGYASTSGDLHDFGARFDEFLATHEPAAALPYLPDVARLEWLYHRSFHAPSHAPLALARLAAVDPDAYTSLRFVLHPAVALLRSAFPVLRIWQVNQSEYSGDQRVDLGEGGDFLLVTRGEDFVVSIARLPQAEYEFLAALQRGEALTQALETALVIDAQFDLQGALTEHVAKGTIVDFSARATG